MVVAVFGPRPDVVSIGESLKAGKFAIAYDPFLLEAVRTKALRLQPREVNDLASRGGQFCSQEPKYGN